MANFSDRIPVQRIIDIARGSIKRQVSDESSAPIIVTKEYTSEEEASNKVTTALYHAEREIEQMLKALDQFRDSTADLCLFSKVGNHVHEILSEHFVEGYIAPIVRGQKLPFMDTDDFNMTRLETVKLLIKEYVDKAN